MFAQAAQSMGYKVLVLDPDPASPAGAVADRHLLAGYADDAALDGWLEKAIAFASSLPAKKK